MITLMNLLAGALGVIFAFKGDFRTAFFLMLAAAVFDFCDGLAARLLHAYSDLGKELDSLSDLVSFGVLPAMMLVQLMRTCSFSDSPWCYVPLTIVLASGLRLARFNVDERQHSQFIGLPTPASAMICGSLCYFTAVCPVTFLSGWMTGFVFVPVLSICLSFLMLSRIPMFSLKFGAGSDSVTRHKRIAFAINTIICVLATAVLRLDWSLAVLLIFTVYVLMNILFAIFRV